MSSNGGALDLLQNRILTHYAAARMILDGQMPAPRTAILYPTYLCNQNCAWCEYAGDNAAYRNMMPEARLAGLLEDLRELGVRGVEFCGGGEPTLHPALPRLIRGMHAHDMRSGVLTNGTMLKGDLAEALIDCASYVRVGFDGATAETADRLKRPASPAAGFDAVRANVRDLLAMRAERGRGPLVSMKVILTGANFAEVEDCVRLALDLGVDSVQFKAARLCDNELTAEEAKAVREAMARARERWPEARIVGGVDKLTMRGQCWLTPLQVMVDALGDVFLCCYYRHRKDAHSIGNAFETPIRELWYSDRHWEAIRDIKPRECSLLDCRFVHYNRVMTELLIDNDAQFEFI